MALWLTRAGRRGEHERKFLEDDRTYCTWTGFARDLSTMTSRVDVHNALREVYGSDGGEDKLGNHSRKVFAFGRRMESGDLVAVPSKMAPTVHIGEITGGYRYDPAPADGPDYHHWRPLRWIRQDVPRENFGQDLLFSLGAFMSICEIKRSDAERRVHAMIDGGWRDPLLSGPSAAHVPPGTTSPNGPAAEDDEATDEASELDLAQAARDAIARLIRARMSGHGLADLVAALLRAQGYTTEIAPPGTDGGVDIVAGTGPLGFGEPRLCVQVKSASSPVDSPTLNQLIGAMQNVGAKQGLLVSWGGFKLSVGRDKIPQFFRVRLWDQDDLMNALFDHDDSLDPDVRSALPLKRVWMAAGEEE